jgi:hypothetical protein
MKGAKDRKPTGAKLKQRAFRGVAMTLTAILGFYGATTYVGYLLGRMRSPDWLDSTTLTTFVYTRHSWRLVAPESQTSPAVVELTIRTPDCQYVYRSDTDEVRPYFLSPGELAAVRRPILSRIIPSSDADRGALLTAETLTVTAATSALAKASRLLARLKWKQGRAIAVGVAIVGGGAALGFFIGYKGEPNYGSADFQKALMNSDRWRAAAKQYLPPAVMPANAPDASPHR